MNASFGRRRLETWELDARERGRPRVSSNSTIGDESETERGGERRSTRTSGAFIHSFVPFRGGIDFDFDRSIDRFGIEERRRVNRA